MKRLPLVILMVGVLLVAVVTGCDRAPRYDGRLVTADSLMRSNPDSALVVVEGVCRDSLAAEGDRAYRDLLLTQARYRAYVTATSDSDINRALAYYRAHSGEREKLTRAYIYKGAVMEELGHPDSAMLYYKHAEATADTTDYSNLGQINVRIASLFRIFYADKQTCYDKYKKALSYYKATGNKHMQLVCLDNMGMCSGIIGDDLSKQILDSASRLAIELKDSSIYYECQEMIIRQSTMNDTASEETKALALSLLENYSRFITPDLIIDIAEIYFNAHIIDSTKYFIGFIYPDKEESLDTRARIRLYSVLSDIAKQEGDLASSSRFIESYDHLADSISNNNEKYRIQQIENTKNSEQIEKISKDRNLNKVIWTFFVVIALSMLILIVHQYHRIRVVKSILGELKDSDIDNHDELLQNIHEKETRIEHLVQNLVRFIQSTINTAEKDPPRVIRKNIQENIRSIVSGEFWSELRSFLDNNYNGIISSIEKNPKINDTDIRFIELACCGFSYIEMAITLGYTPNFVSNKRIRIQKKLGINIPLQDYLNLLMRG